jgi:hypothetical protein
MVVFTEVSLAMKSGKVSLESLEPWVSRSLLHALLGSIEGHTLSNLIRSIEVSNFAYMRYVELKDVAHLGVLRMHLEI